MPVTADVSDAPQVREMVQQGLSRFGHIDILVNNAGSRPGKDRVPVVELEEAAFDEVQRVNVKGTFLCSQAVAREMIQRDREGRSSSSRPGQESAEWRAMRPTAPPSLLSSASPNPWPWNWLPQHQRQRHMPRSR